MDMDLHELGFIVLSEKYMAPTEGVEAEEDLGGALSPARLKLAGLMIVQGIGMVFLVLAVLWLVLLVFKKVFYKEPKNTSKKTEEPAPAAAPVPVASAADNGALVAAITAAVAAYIDSDPALSSQFAGGFRVVSFKPTSKSRNR
jgi:sodium pump decarboxylase gamma subunit